MKSGSRRMARWIIDVGLDTADQKFHQGAAHPGDRLLARRRVDDHFGQQRIIVRRYGLALIEGAVDPDAGAAREMQAA